MAPKRAAKRKAGGAAAAAEAEAEAPAPAQPPAKRGRHEQKPEVTKGPIEHPSHGKIPGTIFVFGDGSSGQIGLGEDVAEKLRPGPLSLPDGLKVLQVACGGMHTLAVAEDGSVWSWGVNDEGALGRETGGELWEKCAKKTGKPQDSYIPGKVLLPADAGRVVQVSGGDSHSAALTEQGVVYAWGTFRGDSGVMGFSDTVRIQLWPFPVLDMAKDRVVKIASGADHIAALTERHAVLTWGSGMAGQLGRLGPRLLDHAREGERSALALQLTPTEVAVMKSNSRSKAADICCGTYSTFLWSTDGKLFAWGLNNYGQLANKENVLWAPTALREFRGSPVAWVTSGQHHTLVCTKEGKLMSMGRATYGRLGQKEADVGKDEPDSKPKAVDGLEGVAIGGASAGLAVSGAYAANGEGLWMWGFGTNGQLAKGDDDDDETVPAKVKQTKGWNAQQVLGLDIGGQHVAVLCTPVEAQQPAT